MRPWHTLTWSYTLVPSEMFSQIHTHRLTPGGSTLCKYRFHPRGMVILGDPWLSKKCLIIVAYCFLCVKSTWVSARRIYVAGSIDALGTVARSICSMIFLDCQKLLSVLRRASLQYFARVLCCLDIGRRCGGWHAVKPSSHSAAASVEPVRRVASFAFLPDNDTWCGSVCCKTQCNHIIILYVV